MAGPLVALEYVHNAIRKEVADLERTLTDLATNDSARFGPLAERFAALDQFLKDHEHAEESVFFPALEERAPHVVRAYEIDHQSNDELMGRIARSVEGLTRAASSTEARGVARELHAHGVALRATMHLHLRKEEQHLVSLAEQLFQPPEQAALVARLSAATPPERFPQALLWVFTRLTAGDRASFLRMLQAGAPPQAFLGMVAVLAGGLPAADWADLRQRVPGVPPTDPLPA